MVHYGCEVEREVGVVPGGVSEEAVLLLEALVESGAWRCVEEADHGGDDAALLNETYLPVEDVLGVAIEAHDEAALDLKSVMLQHLDGGNQVAVGVLMLAALAEAFLVGGLDADEDPIEAGLDHELHHLLL